MTKPSTIQTEIRVSDVLMYYRARATSYFLCFNIAKMLSDKLEKHAKWQEYVTTTEADYSGKNVLGFKQTGYYYYDFMDQFMNRPQFEKLFLAQLEKAINNFFPHPHGHWELHSHSDINFLADFWGMERREFRTEVLEKMVEADPEAVFVIQV